MSRSFYLSVRVLPSAVQGQVAIGYLLARAADSIADTSLIPAAERRERLATLRTAVATDGPDSQRARAAIVAQLGTAPTGVSAGEAQLLAVLGDCFHAFDALAPGDRKLVCWVLDQLTLGMQRDLARFPQIDGGVPPAQVVALTSREDLDEYTYYAAGCVGEFWTDLMAAHLPALAPLAQPDLRARGVALGKALQLVNVVRDVGDDLRGGRCYWPADLLKAHGLSPPRLAELAAGGAQGEVDQAAVRAATQELCDWSLRLCRQAWPYVVAIPPTQVRLRLACCWPLLLALETLAALRRVGSPLLVPGRPIKVARGQVYQMMAESTAAALRDRLHPTGHLDRVFAAHGGT